MNSKSMAVLESGTGPTLSFCRRCLAQAAPVLPLKLHRPQLKQRCRWRRLRLQGQGLHSRVPRSNRARLNTQLLLLAAPNHEDASAPSRLPRLWMCFRRGPSSRAAPRLCASRRVRLPVFVCWFRTSVFNRRTRNGKALRFIERLANRCRVDLDESGSESHRMFTIPASQPHGDSASAVPHSCGRKLVDE